MKPGHGQDASRYLSSGHLFFRQFAGWLERVLRSLTFDLSSFIPRLSSLRSPSGREFGKAASRSFPSPFGRGAGVRAFAYVYISYHTISTSSNYRANSAQSELSRTVPRAEAWPAHVLAGFWTWPPCGPAKMAGRFPGNGSCHAAGSPGGYLRSSLQCAAPSRILPVFRQRRRRRRNTRERSAISASSAASSVKHRRASRRHPNLVVRAPVGGRID